MRVRDTVSAVIRSVRQRFFLLVAVNLVAALCSVPFAIAAAFLPGVPRGQGTSLLVVGLVVAILPTPTCAGLQYVARELVRSDVAYLSEQWTGFVVGGRRAVGAWIISMAGTAVILANLAVYATWHSVAGAFLLMLWVYILAGWVALHLYIYPLLFREEWTGLWRVYRDAFVIFTTKPGFTSLLALIWVIIVGLMTLSAVIGFIGLAIGALIQQRALRAVLDGDQSHPLVASGMGDRRS